MVNPIAFAVFRLTTNSNLLACSTGVRLAALENSRGIVARRNITGKSAP